MPAGQGPGEQDRDAARFAAAVELGRPRGSFDDELMQDLEIVAMLRSRSAAYSPEPDAKARAKQRLMAALSAETTGAPTAAEQTAPMGRILAPSFPATGRVDAVDADATAVTTQMAVITDTTLDASATDDVIAADVVANAPVPIRSGRRSGRHTMPSRPGTRRARSAPSGLRRRVAVVGTAALVTMIALAGAGIFASRDALPGDSLYTLKRAAESAGVALTFDDEARARRHLELATTRLSEIERMAARQPQSPADAELLRTAMQEFDDATGQGSRMLLASDDAGGGAAALGDLRTWAAAQVARLSAIRSALPVPAMADADDSINLLDRLLSRTEALESRSDCTEVISGTVDDLGPLPAEGTCSPRPVDPTDRDGDPAVAGGTEDTPTGPDTAGTPGSATDNPETGAPTEGASPDGLLPGVDNPDIGNLPGGAGVGSPSGSSTTTPAPPAGGAENLSVPVPLPLIPPITLPPLMPGQPGITLG